MKFLATTVLAAGLCFGIITKADSENIGHISIVNFRQLTPVRRIIQGEKR